MMARERTHDEIVDEVVYAAACVIYHYGPGLSDEGLVALRHGIEAACGRLWCDSSWRVDTPDGEGEDSPDFHVRMLSKERDLSFEVIVRRSRGKGGA